MSEMVERVAKAVRSVPDAPGWTYSERVARAAIAEMMEPTPAMADAGCVKDRYGDFLTLDDDAADSWRRMITAALQEPV